MEFVGFNVVMSDIQELFKTIFTTYKGALVIFLCIFIIIYMSIFINSKLSSNIMSRLLLIIQIIILILLSLLFLKIKQNWLFILVNVILGVLIILSLVLMFSIIKCLRLYCKY